MKTSDPQELINLLNDRYYEETRDDEVVPFSYRTDGNTEIIYFHEWPLWSSECDGYASDDDDEFLTDIVYRLYLDHLNRVNSVDPHVLFFNY